jgi:hypothetical protein
MDNILPTLFTYLFYVVLWILPLAGTVLLGVIAWKMWVHYVRQDFISGIDFCLLEIIPPRDVLRSPKAMELFISNALYHFSYKGGLEEYWQGAVWFWYSLEIVSIEGQVHFYIRTPTRIKDMIETQMYAQYPQSQVKVVEDYTLAVPEISEESGWNLWGCEFNLLNPEAFPIKTYTDFGLDKDPKEEYKVDPVSSVIELFGSIGKGEQMWMQVVITPSKKKYHTKGTLFKSHDWVEEAEVTIRKRLEEFTGSRPRAEGDPAGGISKEIRAPAFLDQLVKNATVKITKLGFDTGVRIAYVAKKEVFPFGTRNNNSRNIRLIFRQYESPLSNGFNRINSTQADAYSGIFMASLKTQNLLKKRHLHAYRNREFFHLPLRHLLFNKHTMFFPITVMFKPFLHPETFVLNTEELATIWHFPGQILKVPTLERIESKEASPPPNLPM